MRMSRRRFVGASASLGVTGCLHGPPEGTEDGSTDGADSSLGQEGDTGDNGEGDGEDVDGEGADEEEQDDEERSGSAGDGGSWTSFSYDELNTGYLDVDSPVELDEPWSLDLGSASVSSPAVVDSRVYFGDVDGTLYCVEDDEVVWRHEAEARVGSSPAVDEGAVYYADDAGFVYGLDAETGDEQWRYLSADTFDHDPEISEGPTLDATRPNLYFGSAEGRVHRVDVRDGAERWRVEVNEDVVTAPAVHGDFVYVTTRGAVVYKINAETAEIHSTQSVGDSVRSSPAVVRNDGWDEVFFGSEDRQLYAVKFQTVAGADSVERMWRARTEGAVRTSPAVDGDRVYVGSDDGGLYAFDKESGERLWRYDAGTRIRSSPSLGADALYFGDSSGTVHAIDPEDGERFWSYDTDDYVRSSPAVTGDVYVTATDGRLYRFG